MRDPNILLAVISGILSGSFLSFIQYLITRHDRLEAEAREIDPKDFKLLLNLTRAQSQEHLYTLGKRYLERGEIGIKEWAIYDEHFKAYSAFGWNHYGQEIHDEVEKLPKVPS